MWITNIQGLWRDHRWVASYLWTSAQTSIKFWITWQRNSDIRRFVCKFKTTFLTRSFQQPGNRKRFFQPPCCKSSQSFRHGCLLGQNETDKLEYGTPKGSWCEPRIFFSSGHCPETTTPMVLHISARVLGHQWYIVLRFLLHDKYWHWCRCIQRKVLAGLFMTAKWFDA